MKAIKLITKAISWIFGILLILGALAKCSENIKKEQEAVSAPTVQQTVATPAPSNETMNQRWVREMRALGGRCAGHADHIQSLMNQFGENSPMVTRGFDMAADNDCF